MRYRHIVIPGKGVVYPQDSRKTIAEIIKRERRYAEIMDGNALTSVRDGRQNIITVDGDSILRIPPQNYRPDAHHAFREGADLPSKTGHLSILPTDPREHTLLIRVVDGERYVTDIFTPISEGSRPSRFSKR